MKFFSIMLVLVVAVLATVIVFMFLPRSSANEICLKQNCFEVEVASTEAQRVAGLSNRDVLPVGTAMLFVFETEGQYPFWMKDMKFPLDIIWISNSGTVVFIESNAQPCNAAVCVPINQQQNAKYVLEVNAGNANSSGLKVGDEVEIKIA
ncbi:MAG: DUF192 domain-containing protein [Candidatus Micrarchaeota archaeon]|nr:DUF192 domain-containing protein [Candidatus Micrarchaeota archaeon]